MESVCVSVCVRVFMYIYKATHVQYNTKCQPSTLYIHLALLLLLHYFLIPNIKYKIRRKIP
jgi:hypothetical protein